MDRKGSWILNIPGIFNFFVDELMIYTWDESPLYESVDLIGLIPHINYRSYFRCAFKHDQGCLAIKQVQKTQDKPDMYEITYIGIHTCNTTPNNEAIFLVDTDPDEEITTSIVTDKQKQELMEFDDVADDAAVLMFQSLATEFGDNDFHFDQINGCD